MNRTRRVELNVADTTLAGKYYPGDDAYVMCDASDGNWTLTMPDAETAYETVFHIIRKDTTNANTVTVVPIGE